jgi:hypothetical protein
MQIPWSDYVAFRDVLIHQSTCKPISNPLPSTITMTFNPLPTWVWPTPRPLF